MTLCAIWIHDLENLGSTNSLPIAMTNADDSRAIRLASNLAARMWIEIHCSADDRERVSRVIDVFRQGIVHSLICTAPLASPIIITQFLIEYAPPSKINEVYEEDVHDIVPLKRNTSGKRLDKRKEISTAAPS